MIQVLNNLPPEYDVVVDNLENKLCAEGDSKLTIEQVREKLNGWYEKFKKRNFNLENSGGSEKALNAKGHNGYKGTCPKCGKYGHKSSKCRSNPGNNDEEKDTQANRGNRNKSGFQGYCYNCGRYGHAKANCKFKKSNEAANKIDEEEDSSSEEEYSLNIIEPKERKDEEINDSYNILYTNKQNLNIRFLVYFKATRLFASE